MNRKPSDRQRSLLLEQLQTTTDAQVCRRSGALLRLDEGRPVAEVAYEFGVTRQTIYNWRARWEDNCRELADARRSGRPTKWTAEVIADLEQALGHSPRDYGFQMVGWTSSLLRTYLQQTHGLEVSQDSIRSKLHELGYVWKRFRYRLKSDPERVKKTTYPQCYQ